MTTRTDWKNKPLSDKADKVVVDFTFSAQDFERLKLGYKPQDMDDRWFICFEDNYLYFHRSWTGHCIFKLKIEKVSDDKYSGTELWIERDQNIFNSSNDTEAIDTVRQLIENKLLK
jgi:hypothetical protein